MRADPLRTRTTLSPGTPLRREHPHTFRHPRPDKAAHHHPRFSNGPGDLDRAFSYPQIYLTMKHILAKIDRIRASSTAMLQVPDNSPHAVHNGKIFKVHSMGTPGVKCRVSLLINEQVVDLTLSDVL